MYVSSDSAVDTYATIKLTSTGLDLSLSSRVQSDFGHTAITYLENSLFKIKATPQ